MKEIRNHPYMSSRTVKAWVLDDGRFLQVIDVRDLFHDNYSVEFEAVAGGLDSVYSSPILEKCLKYAESFTERNPTR